MKNIVKVRHLKLGEGVPKVCVSIVGKTNEEIIEEIKYLKGLNLDLVEWRVDYYKDVENIDKVKDTLIKIREEIEDLPLIFTFRSKKEGGEKELPIEYYSKLNKEIASTKIADLIDIEAFIGDEIVKDIVNFAHSSSVIVLMSNHDFYKTPEKEEIINRLCKMQDLNADLAKIAVMPQSQKDVIILLSATEEMVRKYATIPIITMSMGGVGLISRLAGEIFGSVLTFASGKVSSAPGQIGVEDLHRVLDTIHENKYFSRGSKIIPD
ncbi:MAG: type I 3-dehydroquinate dehydratase [Romboutsia sp.]